MVWHAFLLSPIKYETFCKAGGKEEMLKLQFPWLLIVGYPIHIQSFVKYS